MESAWLWQNSKNWMQRSEIWETKRWQEKGPGTGAVLTSYPGHAAMIPVNP